MAFLKGISGQAHEQEFEKSTSIQKGETELSQSAWTPKRLEQHPSPKAPTKAMQSPSRHREEKKDIKRHHLPGIEVRLIGL